MSNAFYFSIPRYCIFQAYNPKIKTIYYYTNHIAALCNDINLLYILNDMSMEKLGYINCGVS